MEARDDTDTEEMKRQENEDEEKMEDDDSVESSGESDNEMDEQLLQLEQQVQASPYQYDAHTLLIQKLRTAGEFDKLRVARERMAAIFPLTAEIWLAWIEDERKVMDENDRSGVSALFERAIKDYTTVEVWLEYIQFSIGGMGEDGGIEAVRVVCEKAITATGLHVTKGCMIWEAYREYENAILMGLQPMPGSVATPSQQEQITAQTKRVSAIFRRQLAVPLSNMLTTWEEFKDFTEEDEQQKARPLHEKALSKLEKLMPLENSLDEEDNLSKFEDYIDFELENGEPARIQCIFERALVTHCLIPRLWVRYTQYLDAELKIPNVILSVYERAVRNCPWSSELWCGYGRAQERYSRPHSETKDVFTRALSGGFTSGVEYLTVWNAHIDYLRRRVKAWAQGDQEQSEEEAELWSTFDQAIQHLYENFGADADAECTLQRYKARLKAKHSADMAATRDEWNEVMQAGHGNKAAMWLEFFNLERCYGDHKHARKILQRALNSANDWPESVVQAYIRFEREEGDTVELYDAAVCRCEAQMARIEERRAKAAEKEAAQEAQKKSARKEKKAAKKIENKQSESTGQWANQSRSQNQPSRDKVQPKIFVRGQKQPMAEQTLPTETRPYKRKADSEAEQDNMSDKDGEFKVPSAPGQAPSPKKAPPPGYKGPKAPPPGFKGPPPGAKTKAPPPGYKGPTDTQEEPPEKKQKLNDPEQDKPYVVDSSLESRTAFVSNLDFKATEDDIKQVLEKAGEITDLRLIKSFSGKSKGYAYVEFLDELMVNEAVKLDRTPIDGRPVFISKCNEKGNSAASFRYATSMEKNKLFVKGLPFKMTKEELEELFGQIGPVKDVRIVTYRSGASKGLAYVEYQNENDASQAVMKMDSHEIGEHTISVAISNPPQRKAPAGSSTFKPALGGGKRDVGARGRSGTQVSLVPRALQRKPPDTQANTSASNGSDNKPAEKMSNQDFRAMLLKK